MRSAGSRRSIEIAVDALHEASIRTLAFGASKAVEQRERPTCADLEYRSVIRRAARVRRPVEISVGPLHQAYALRLIAITAAEVVQLGEGLRQRGDAHCDTEQESKKDTYRAVYSIDRPDRSAHYFLPEPFLYSTGARLNCF